MQDKQGSMLLAHNVVGCLLPFIFCSLRELADGQPRSGLMFLCSFVLLFTALAAAMIRYGVSSV